MIKSSYKKAVPDMKGTGQKIKTVMEQKGITPRQVQARLGFPYVQTIYNWFAGKNMPNLDNLLALESILGVKMDDLVAKGTVPFEYEEE